MTTNFLVKLYNEVSGNLHTALSVAANDTEHAVELAGKHLSLDYAAVPTFNPNQFRAVAVEDTPTGTVTEESIAARTAALAATGGTVAVNYDAQIRELQGQVKSLMDYIRSGLATPQPTDAPSSAPADLPHAPAPAAPVAAPAAVPGTGIAGLVPPGFTVGAPEDSKSAAEAMVSATSAQIQAEIDRLTALRDAKNSAGGAQ